MCGLGELVSCVVCGLGELSCVVCGLGNLVSCVVCGWCLGWCGM